MTVKKGHEYNVTIDDLAYGGRGLTRIDGLTVFVDQALPQDTVKIRIWRKKKNYAEARVLEIIVPSPYRISPPCPYSGWCGGCKWQHLDYPWQLHYKRQHVSDALNHIAGISDVTVHAVIPSKKQFGYRNKMEFSCSDRRWLLPDQMGIDGVDRDFALGLHVPGTYYKIIDIEQCLLQPDTGNAILGEVKECMRQSGLPMYGIRSHTGFWRFLMLRHSVAHDEWMVNLVTASEDTAAVSRVVDHLTAAFDRITSIVNNITARRAGIAVGEFERHLYGNPVIRDRIGPFEFEISANSFFQTNTRGAETLYDIVKKFARLSGKESVLDLYSGTGTIPIWLAASAREVLGIEVVASALADAEENCRRYNIGNCRFLSGDIREVLPSIDHRPDVTVVDPPRSGMHKDVVKQLVDMGSPRIVYVSCNPATLARDLALMTDTYRVAEVQPVDMFPHTYHIEAVARLERMNSR